LSGWWAATIWPSCTAGATGAGSPAPCRLRLLPGPAMMALLRRAPLRHGSADTGGPQPVWNTGQDGAHPRWYICVSIPIRARRQPFAALIQTGPGVTLAGRSGIRWRTIRSIPTRH